GAEQPAPTASWRPPLKGGGQRPARPYRERGSGARWLWPSLGLDDAIDSRHCCREPRALLSGERRETLVRIDAVTDRAAQGEVRREAGLATQPREVADASRLVPRFVLAGTYPSPQTHQGALLSELSRAESGISWSERLRLPSLVVLAVVLL